MFDTIQPVRRAYERFGIAHTFGRGLEFALLQTRPTSWLYWRFVPRYYNWKCSRDLRQYAHPPDPFAYRYVQPNAIERFSARGTVSEGNLTKVGRVIGGNWDRQDREPGERPGSALEYAPRIDETPLYRALVSHFERGVPWEETAFVRAVTRLVANGDRVWHGCRSIADIERRCETLDRVYEDMRENGYRTQRELREPRPSIDEPFGFLNEHIMEVAVDITRDGEFVLVDGRHRLILAQILDFEAIPVTVVVRHERWMERREALLNGEESLDHPDVSDEGASRDRRG